MENLDLKDRKILYHLDLDSRQSFAQIGKKVGLSKEVVKYRVGRMEEQKLITGYWTTIDSYRFGYQVYRYYLILQNASLEIKNQMINHIVHYKNTWVVSLLTGPYDMNPIIWVKSIPEFYRFWDDFNQKYGDYIAEKIFSLYLQADVYPLSYLLFPEYDKSDRDKYLQTVGGEPIKIDKIDYDILNELAENARISLIELSKKLHCSSQSVDYRIKNLMRKGIIQGFHVGIDTAKIGFHEFKVDIWLKDLPKRKQIWNYIKYNPYVTFINTSAGYADLEIEFTVEDTDKLHEIMEEVYSQFPGAIRKYIYFSSKKSFKLRCLPEMTRVDFKS
jgi:DNA-binding Lrp family transcriptional regulator